MLSNTPIYTLPSDPAKAERAKAVVFSDPASRALFSRLEKVAPSEAPILIMGETGTGKEILARRLHESSGRSGPFVAVNCGAINETLAESEFFGHEAGAFTGALRQREGYFEAARGGTLFLDEIGELPLILQTRLLRVLQEKEVVRVGARKPVPIDVRVVAATNVDLQAAVQAGQFRRDLYYRINLITLPVAPLRERTGDILPLAEHFLERYALRQGQPTPELGPDIRQALLRHPWPGNIRELENVMHAALLLAHQGDIRPEHLLLDPDLTPISHSVPTPAVEAGMVEPDELINHALTRLLAEATPDLFSRLERQIVRTALTTHRFNQVRTAQALGISRHALRTLMKRHGWLDGAQSTHTGLPLAHLARAV
ncbi:DNA-binding NtrC family response regulator [Silvimonas terrae]|uniref:DNA-binding NtrC family response regulator n=1 Tax=Silvimonas terrae TaxID=300266 RepID=A0A840RH80_9NEIS|nr:sigma 54-interacting transcriptional regulator [Silvimonas terrae]MBB5191642.1 DNA-binding NtrC family response regulator [Silvimonas terrae]